jgi:trans-2,3-dihydro-3-hydroxyanthranilate isomerase
MTFHDYVVLDVFADRPLEGNPLAVFLDGSAVPGETMQRAAREFNLSEIVFLLEGDEAADARARIFTPAAELAFAGHPVLGSAFVVGERLGLDTVRLRTGAGVLGVRLERQGDVIVSGEMEQPLPEPHPFEHEAKLLAALGVTRSQLPVQAYRNGPLHVYVMLESQDRVAALDPDLGALTRLGSYCVSCFAGSGTRFRTRMFAPALGVPEDPATGSAAGPLAVHLARHGVIGFGSEIEIMQGVEIGRPSRLRARAEGTPERIEAVRVGGAAVTVAHGRYRLA